MKAQKIQIAVPHRPMRAVELYAHGTPFRHKTQRDRTKYTRKSKHKGEF